MSVCKLTLAIPLERFQTYYMDTYYVYVENMYDYTHPCHAI